MKRSLQRVYWVGILMTLMMSIISVSMMVIIKIDGTREDLRSVIQVASAWTLEADEDLQSMAIDIASISPPMRVTFLMGNGHVLADSHEDEANMASHLDRPEVMEAIAGGTGESLRLSDTQATLVLYEAKLIAPDLILRLSYPIEEITHLVMYYAIGLIILFMAAYAVLQRAIMQFSRQMQKQMDDVRLLLEGDPLERTAVFPEFQPAISNIAYLARKLNRGVEEVRRTMNLRSDFVANASHELRSPLTSIMGFAEMIDEGLADTPEEQKMCIELIRKECTRMLEVIEDILLLSRSERPPAHKENVHVRKVAEEICQALHPIAQQKQIHLQLSGESNVYASEKAIWEILYNLIDNAIHYGRNGGYVRIGLSDGCISVEDNGIGINKKHIPHLFEQFYRVDEAREMSENGSGLGLSIVKALADQYGAQIHVDSTIGRGSCFRVTFGKNKEDSKERSSGS